MDRRTGVIHTLYGGFGEAIGRIGDEPLRWMRDLERRAERLERQLVVGRAHVDARVRLRFLRMRIGALRRIERVAATAVSPLPIVSRRDFARVDRQVAQLARELRALDEA
jgi:predicted ThiF/HesA family dinucleotide-utilizing enzyme